MAASTSDITTNEIAGVAYLLGPLVAATRIFKGTLVGSNAAGYFSQLGDTANQKFRGICSVASDNRSGGTGDTSCEYLPAERLGDIIIDAVSPDQSWVGQLIYASDDHTGALSTSNSVLIGLCEGVVKTGTSGRILVNPNRRVV
jgi:hypothetical protein